MNVVAWLGFRSAQMRIILVAIFAAFCMLAPATVASAGTYQDNGTYTGIPSPSVTRLFAAFPNGGDGLVNAIRELLINNPTLADDVAFVASRGNAAQQDAAAAGLAQAIIVFALRGDRVDVAVISRAAQLSGNLVLQTAVLAALGGANSPANLYQSNNPSALTNCKTVSPAQPGNC
jgi:hypothetical protein